MANKLIIPQEAAKGILKIIKEAAKGDKELEVKLLDALSSSLFYGNMG